MRNFDIMIANRDRAIHAAAAGKPAPVDDSNVPPLDAGPEARGANEWLIARRRTGRLQDRSALRGQLLRIGGRFPRTRLPDPDALGRARPPLGVLLDDLPARLPGQKPNDKIVILEDTDRDGKADNCNDLRRRPAHPALLRARWQGRQSTSPRSRTSASSRTPTATASADHREIVLTGFGCEDSHHALHDFVWTPGGDLMFRESIFHNSQVETALRSGAGEELVVVPLPPGHAQAHHLRQLSEHQPVGRDLRRLGQPRRHPPGLRHRLPRDQPPYPEQHPGARHAGLLRCLRPRVRRFRFLAGGDAGRLPQGALQADQPRRDPPVGREGGLLRGRICQ